MPKKYKRKYITNPTKKLIGKIIENIVGGIIDKTIEPLQHNNLFDKETINHGFEVKGCRMFNNKKIRSDRKGKFVINKKQFEEFKKKCKQINKEGIYWFCVYFDDEPKNYNMLHCYLNIDGVEELLKGLNGNSSVYWDKVFRKGNSISRLQLRSDL